MKKILVILMGMFLLNCGAIFLGSSQNVSFNTSPDRATVVVNGAIRGETPVNLKLKTNEYYIITFKKEGYEDKTYSITNHVSGGIVVLDVLGGLLPIVIDAATGSWYRLDETTINLPLDIKRIN